METFTEESKDAYFAVSDFNMRGEVQVDVDDGVVWYRWYKSKLSIYYGGTRPFRKQRYSSYLHGSETRAA